MGSISLRKSNPNLGVKSSAYKRTEKWNAMNLLLCHCSQFIISSKQLAWRVLKNQFGKLFSTLVINSIFTNIFSPQYGNWIVIKCICHFKQKWHYLIQLWSLLPSVKFPWLELHVMQWIKQMVHSSKRTINHRYFIKYVNLHVVNFSTY